MQLLRELIHGGDLDTWRARLQRLDFLDFSANINPLGQPQSVREALRDSAGACERYPDQLCRALIPAIARFEQVPEQVVLCGNGAADIIYRIAYGLRPKTVLLLAPTFAEYEQALLNVNCQITRHILEEGNGFALDETILPKVKAHELTVLCNPNNPTGSLIDPALMAEILRECEQSGATLVVDECFLDFLPDAGRHTLKGRLAVSKNLIILKAFTKIFAMPGLRLGYGLISDPSSYAVIERAGAPWSVSVPAQLCGIAAVEEHDYLERTRALIADQRVSLERMLTDCGCKVFPGTVNYILFKTAYPDFALRLCEKGIVIRDCSNYHGLTQGFYRVAVRTQAENNALIKAIKEIMPCQQ